MKTIRFTKEGFEELKKKLETLKNQRPSAVLDLKKARDQGDLSENGYYKSARLKLTEIDRNLRLIGFQVKNAFIVENKNKNIVGIGTRVKLSNGITFLIVGDLEAKPSEKKISLLSPIGQALEGKKQGDKVEITTPQEKLSYKILEVIN